MPTRFGNAMKVFETYPREMYGAEGVVLWPRLLPIASHDYVAGLQEERTQLDVLVNSCALAALLALACAVSGLISGHWADVARLLATAHEATSSAVVTRSALALLPLREIGWTIGASVAAWWLYVAAVDAVPGYGELFKAGFDCYLPDLARKHGYALPDETDKRREFWEDLRDLLSYGHLPGGPAPPILEKWLKKPAAGR